MLITNAFTVPLPVEQAWPLLLDVPLMARAMPGAQLTEVVDPRRFRGSVALKLGPVNLSFAGEAHIEDLDEAGHNARIATKASDTKGRGGAQATVSFALLPEGEATRVVVTTDLLLSGAVAQYGRGAGLIKDVAQQIIGTFAANLAREIEGSGAADGDGGAAKPISGLRVVGKVLAARALGMGKVPEGSA